MNSFVSATTIAPQPQAATGEEVVRLVGVKRQFGATAALDGISLSVKRGEILGIIGRSGAGKSTLIRCLNGLERADSGEIRIEGRDITGRTRTGTAATAFRPRLSKTMLRCR